MANVIISFTHPTDRVDGNPILPGEITDVQVSARVQGSPVWTEIAVVDFPGASVRVQDVAPGDWEYQGVVRGVGADSAPLTAQIAVPFAQLGPLATFDATLE